MTVTDIHLFQGYRRRNTRRDHEDGSDFLRAAQEYPRQGVGLYDWLAQRTATGTIADITFYQRLAHSYAFFELT